MTAQARVALTPLDPWIAGIVNAGSRGEAGGEEFGRVDPAALARWQLDRLNETLELARRTAFHGPRLADSPARLASLAEVRRLPTMDAEDLRARGEDMLAVSQGEIARMVTLPTSGTSGPPKRLGFTGSDLERTADFFHHGMTTFTRPGQRVLVLMPGERPGSVGDLLERGLARFGAQAVQHGLVDDPARVLERVEREAIDVLVAIPAQALRLARQPGAEKLRRRPSAVLLSADVVSAAVRRAVEAAFGCPAFTHYGLTETGLGGGVECQARHGYHVREADLYFEIVDAAGQPVPDGETGEVAVTTLTRKGLPLIRYRTGDQARFLPEPCPCGSALRRLGPVTGRLADRHELPGGGVISTALLDEALLELSWLHGYRAALAGSFAAPVLDLEVEAPVRAATDFLPGGAGRASLAAALRHAGIGLPLGAVALGDAQSAGRWPPKRFVADLREGRPNSDSY